MNMVGLKIYLTLYSLGNCSSLSYYMFYPYYLKKDKYVISCVNLMLSVIFFFFFLVLPKFDVMITTPLYYSLREEDVTGVVTAK